MSRLRLFLRIWFKYYDDAIMYGSDWAQKEYKARMWAFRNISAHRAAPIELDQ